MFVVISIDSCSPASECGSGDNLHTAFYTLHITMHHCCKGDDKSQWRTWNEKKNINTWWHCNIVFALTFAFWKQKLLRNSI